MGGDLDHLLSRVGPGLGEEGGEGPVEREGASPVGQRDEERLAGPRRTPPGRRDRAEELRGPRSGEADDRERPAAGRRGERHDRVRPGDHRSPAGAGHLASAGGGRALTFFRSLATHHDWGSVARFAVR